MKKKTDQSPQPEMAPGVGNHQLTGRLIGDCLISIWGMSGTERAHRALKRAGCEHIITDGNSGKGIGPQLLLRTDYVIEERLLQALVSQPNTILYKQQGTSRIAIAARVDAQEVDNALKLISNRIPLNTTHSGELTILSASELAGGHNKQLRKNAPPYLYELTEDQVSMIAEATFNAAYKGVTDLVTKYAWPFPARLVTQALARLHITPNTVTFVSLLFTLATLYFFWQGQFIAGLASGYAMAFLDTVDGKLARVTLTSSKWGNVFDHGIDLVSPPLWWLAWWFGLQGLEPGGTILMLALVLGGHTAGKLLEQSFISTFGLKVHIWQRFDSQFRLITARRNPNLLILSIAVLFGAPGFGFIAMAIWIWSSLLLHTCRFVQALVEQRTGQKIQTWLE